MNSIRIEAVTKTYRGPTRSPVLALDNVSWQVQAGKISGLVGESGSGKTTLIRCIVGLERINSGRILCGDEVLQPTSRATKRPMRRGMQLVFQDPTASLNPRMNVGQLVGEGLQLQSKRNTRSERRDRVAELLLMVGLDPRDSQRYPRSFSGGQRQRIAIARALAVEPDILICDEPVSALDVSVQAQVLNLLQDMQERLGLTILLVAHDLAVIQQICSEVAVIEHGRLVEQGSTSAVMGDPQHPYTRSLLEAVPVPDPVLAREKAQRRRARLDLSAPMESPPAAALTNQKVIR